MAKVRRAEPDMPNPKPKEDGEGGDKEKRQSRRNQNPTILFVNGHAEGWAFHVPEAFRPALDIALSTLLDKAGTHELRLQKLQEMGFASWDDLKRQTDSGERLHIQKQITQYKRFRQVWTEGLPAIYDFHEGDTLYSTDGVHVVQVGSVAADGMLSVRVFNGDGRKPAVYLRTVLCTQAEFMAILRDGFPKT